MSAHDLTKQVKLYKIIGAILIVGTIITVMASNVHLGIILGIIVALVIAGVKGTLVAGYFMHLFDERRLIYGVLALTAGFIVVMIGLLLFATGDQQGHRGGAFSVPQKFAEPHHAEGEHVP
jgi:caa(3)-type oxidase subunit IV